MHRFYDGAPQAYFALGEESARWAVTAGPYRSFIAGRDFDGFAEFFPRTWSVYFVETSSYCTTRVTGSSIDFEAFDLPLWHPYFEYFVAGYFKGALDLICANPIQVEQVQGGAGRHYHYRLWMTSGAAHRPFVSGKAGLTGPDDVEKVASFVEEHLDTDVGLDDLAEIVAYGPDQLARWFKRSFGMPLHQYVLRRRLDRAKALLTDPAKSIADVAQACGFGSQSHFTAFFKARVGVTPGAYRREPGRRPSVD
jgi:AraC-like DNA-binding protein